MVMGGGAPLLQLLTYGCGGGAPVVSLLWLWGVGLFVYVRWESFTITDNGCGLGSLQLLMAVGERGGQNC